MKKDENHWFSLLFFLGEKRMKSVEAFCCFLFVCLCLFCGGVFLLFFFKFKATFLIRFMSYDALHEDVKLHINADLFL